MRLHVLEVVFLGLFVMGCGGPTNKPLTEADMADNALNDVGELYRVYTVQFKKPPKSTADFAPLEQMSPTGFDAIRKGEVIVRFGATLPDTNEGPSSVATDEVLAYLKNVPDSGGKVLMLNRAIKTLTADEFKAAKLAGTSSSEEETGSAKKKK